MRVNLTNSRKKDLLKAMEKMGALSADSASHNVRGIRKEVQIAHFVS